MLNGKSWKTSIAGSGMALGGLAIIGALIFHPVVLPATAVIMIAGCGVGLISGAVGLINAKDSNVTTENGTNVTVRK